MVRNPCVWPAPMNKMAGTRLGEMADQTVMGSVHNSDHGAFASNASCGGSLKASDSSPLVSPTAIFNMSRGQFNVDVAATFGVSLINVGDLDVLIKDIEAGNHEELLSGMTNNMHEAAMDALSVSIQDKPGSYIVAAGGSRPKPSAAGGSKLDLSISKAKFRSLFLENLCEGVYVSIPRKVVEREELTRIPIWVKIHDVPIQVLSEDGLSIIASQIGKPIMLDSYTSSMSGGEVSIPITVVTPVVLAPIVEMTNDGF
ncbi:zinc knuckle CX2CX4HX4C containing protein [Tanacetum coccineum]